MSKTKLERLDDRIMELSCMDSAYRIGVSVGMLNQLQKQAYYRGYGPDPGEPPRSNEKRLQSHLEREFRRLAKAKR